MPVGSTNYLNPSQKSSQLQISDYVIRTLSPKKRKLQMDNTNLNDFISIEESEKRIILLSFFCSIMLALVSSGIIFYSENLTLKSQIVCQPLIPTKKELNPQSRIHVAIITKTGQILDFHIIGMKIIRLAWTLTVPKSRDYFGFSADRKIHIIYGDNNQDCPKFES